MRHLVEAERGNPVRGDLVTQPAIPRVLPEREQGMGEASTESAGPSPDEARKRHVWEAEGAPIG